MLQDSRSRRTDSLGIIIFVNFLIVVHFDRNRGASSFGIFPAFSLHAFFHEYLFLLPTPPDPWCFPAAREPLGKFPLICRTFIPLALGARGCGPNEGFSAESWASSQGGGCGPDKDFSES